MMALFESMRTGSYSLSEPLRRLRATMSTLNERVLLIDSELTYLAEWLLMEPGSVICTRMTRAKRPAAVHLIGRDLIYALAHAEYLIFVRNNLLPLPLCKKLSRLRRTTRRGGLDGSDSVPNHRIL